MDVLWPLRASYLNVILLAKSVCRYRGLVWCRGKLQVAPVQVQMQLKLDLLDL